MVKKVGTRKYRSPAEMRELRKILSNKQITVEDEYQATKVTRRTKGEKSRRKKVPLYGFPPEAKSLSASGTVALTTTLAQIAEFTAAITRGTDSINRIGDKINLRAILSRITISSPAANGLGDNCMVRVMLVYDRQSNGAVADLGKLLANQTVAQSAMNSDYAGRYRVIWDKLIPIISDTSKNNVMFSNNNVFKTALPVSYDASAGAITDVERGSLTLVAMYQVADTMTTAPNIYYNIKLTYYDQ